MDVASTNAAVSTPAVALPFPDIRRRGGRPLEIRVWTLRQGGPAADATDPSFAKGMARRDVGPHIVVADDAEDLHFTEAGRRQPQIRLVARPALRSSAYPIVSAGAFRSLTGCRGRGSLPRSWSSRSASRLRRRAASICSRVGGRMGSVAGAAVGGRSG